MTLLSSNITDHPMQSSQLMLSKFLVTLGMYNYTIFIYLLVYIVEIAIDLVPMACIIWLFLAILIVHSSGEYY